MCELSSRTNQYRRADRFVAGHYLQVALDAHPVEDRASDFQIVGLMPGEGAANNLTNDD
ncbi:MAG: hypothetical protein WA183_00630 [Chthoniobacterales bacterium]